MSRSGKRVRKVELSLTPGQAAVVAMEEAHRHDSLSDWGAALKGAAEHALPVNKLVSAVEQSVLGAMTGAPWRSRDSAAAQAVREVIFLYHLHLGANVRALEEVERLRPNLLLLERELELIARREMLSGQALQTWSYISNETPYPVSAELAATVDAASANYVKTWQSLEDVATIADWVTVQYVAEGRAELPFGADSVHAVDGFGSSLPLSSDQELRLLFDDDAAYQEFAARRDFSHGLADVRDEEFEARCDAVEAALRELVKEGEVQAGTAVELETISIACLREVALVDGRWLDRAIVELAELGAILRGKRYSACAPDDDHVLAGDVILTRSGAAAGDDSIGAARDEAHERLVKFPGKTRTISGRPHLSFEPYAAWKGRQVRGGMDGKVRDGFVARSWNAWVDAHGGDGVAELAGVRVAHISAYFESAPRVVYDDEAQAAVQQRRRREVLADLRSLSLSTGQRDGFWARAQSPGAPSFGEQVHGWRARVEGMLRALLTRRAAFEVLGDTYFAGSSVLFRDVAAALEGLAKGLERYAELFNSHFATQLEDNDRLCAWVSGRAGDEDALLTRRIDIASLTPAADAAGGIVTVLVDLAKAEALTALDEHGAAARELIGRHIAGRDHDAPLGGSMLPKQTER